MKPDFDKVEAGYRLILEGLGADLNDAHFKDTPTRAAKAMCYELCSHIGQEPPFIRMFPLEGQAQMVVLGHIPVKSLCAHHLLPFIGEAVVGYIAGMGEVVGLSKLSRVVDYYARRPTVQEKLTNDIADFLADRVVEDNHIIPSGGVGVVIRARHMCMELRGVNHAGAMVTSALRGVFDEAEVRAEFLELARREFANEA